MNIFIQGLGEGFLWANTELEFNKRPLLYCQPGKLLLGSENYKDILDRQIDEMRKIDKKFNEDKYYIGIILLEGLKETFPCKNKQ